MSADYFIFGGFDSRNYNIWLHNGSSSGRERFLVPPRTSITDRPLGASGAMLFNRYYTPKDITLDIYCEDQSLDEIRMQEICAYLSGLGEKQLILSYEDYKYYDCILDDAVVSTQYSQGMIIHSITFKVLKAFGFSRFTTSEIETVGFGYDETWLYDSGLMYLEDMNPYTYNNLTNNQVIAIYHGGNNNLAYPVLKFTGAATTLKIEQFDTVACVNKLAEFNYGAFSGTLDIDCNLTNVFKNGVIDNRTSSGQFFNLYGLTTPKYIKSGVIQNYSGNTITLSSTASSANDYYNGMFIYMLNKDTCKMESRTVTDYVGSTKLLTLDSAFTSIDIGDSYTINDPTDGVNYFRISGTGFSNLNVTFDFRYVYI